MLYYMNLLILLHSVFELSVLCFLHFLSFDFKCLFCVSTLCTFLFNDKVVIRVCFFSLSLPTKLHCYDVIRFARPFFILGPMPFFPFPYLLFCSQVGHPLTLALPLLSPNFNCIHHDVIAMQFCKEAKWKKADSNYWQIQPSLPKLSSIPSEKSKFDQHLKTLPFQFPKRHIHAYSVITNKNLISIWKINNSTYDNVMDYSWPNLTQKLRHCCHFRFAWTSSRSDERSWESSIDQSRRWDTLPLAFL